jgi:hypothetical protein
MFAHGIAQMNQLIWIYNVCPWDNTMNQLIWIYNVCPWDRMMNQLIWIYNVCPWDNTYIPWSKGLTL